MTNQANILNLPSHLINDILSRLPPKTIIQCRCVCKTWLNLLTESEFINLHLSRSPPCLITHNLDVNSSDSFNFVEFHDEADQHGLFHVSETKIRPPKSCAENSWSLTMVGSINGLICLNEFGPKHEVIYLWNPAIGESISLPEPDGLTSYPNIVGYAFGLTSETGKYKVVRILRELEKNTRRTLNSTCDIYTLGEETGLWRRFGHAPFVDTRRIHSVFLNGNLHWLIHDKDSPELISCFDLEKELFSPFPAPPEVSKDFNLASLGVFEGHLSICDNSSDNEIVIWVMKEYGIAKNWSKEIVIDKEPADLVGPSYEVVSLIKVLKNGDILLLWRDDILLFYDLGRKILHQLNVHVLIKNLDDQMNEDGYAQESYTCIEAIEYVSSFLSLKNFGNEVVESVN